MSINLTKKGKKLVLFTTNKDNAIKNLAKAIKKQKPKKK